MASNFENSIKINSSGLVLNDFLIDEPNITNYFNDLQEKDGSSLTELRNQLISLLNLGYMTRKSVQVSDKVDYVDKSFDSLKQDMQHQIEHKFSDSMRDRLDSFLGSEGIFTRELQETFGADGAHAQKINDLVSEYQKQIQSILDVNDDSSPLKALERALDSRYVEIFAFMKSQEKTQDIVEGTTLKGKEFEHVVEHVLVESAPDFNCVFENTSEVTGTGGKKGDFVLTLKDSKKKIVLEAKKLSKDPKLKDVKSYLDESLKNRTADYSIYVYCDSTEDSMPELGMFNEFEDDKLFVVVSDSDSFEATSRVIRLACGWALQRLKDKVDDNYDLSEKLDLVQNKISERLKQIKEIRVHSKNITKTCNSVIGDMELDLGLRSE